MITYTTVACSVPRTDRITRDRAFRTGTRSGSLGQGEAKRRAADFYQYPVRSSQGWLGPALRKAQGAGLYRWIINNGRSYHVPLFVGSRRIDVGSCYLKQTGTTKPSGGWWLLIKARSLIPNRQVASLRVWWELRCDMGRNIPVSQLPPDLGDEIERAVDAIRPGIDAHQAALLAATEMAGHPIPTDVSQTSG